MENKYARLLETQYSNFKSTLQQCGMYLTSALDKDIEYIIFEELDINIRCFITEEILNKFVNEGMIDEDIQKNVIFFREKFIAIEKEFPEIWNVASVKKSEIWQNIFQLSDHIKEKLYY